MARGLTGIRGSTPCNIQNTVSVVEPYPPILIEIVGTYAPRGLNVRQQVSNKRQSTSPGLVGKSPKLDTIVDGKLPDNINSTSIFSKEIVQKLTNSSRRTLYTHFRMNFAADQVQTQTLQITDLGCSTINAFDEVGGLSSPASRI